MTTTATRPRRELNRRAPNLNLERARQLQQRQIAFIPNATFGSADDQIDWVNSPRLKAVEGGDTTETMPKLNGLPAHLMRMCETPVMKVEEERAFFRRMNSLKFQAAKLRATLSADRPSKKKLDQIEDLLERAERIRNYIIQANTRLVMSIAKKFSDANNVFDDMLSEGITSLMHAVEKFDYDRGFRFSTYATTSIQRDLYRMVVKANKQKSRFSTGADEVFAACPEDQAEVKRMETTAHETYGSLTKMIEQLDPREKLIIRHRFGFDTEGGRKATYTSLGRQLGISKERVRQLAERAMSKLRHNSPEFGLASLEA